MKIVMTNGVNVNTAVSLRVTPTRLDIIRAVVDDATDLQGAPVTNRIYVIPGPTDTWAQITSAVADLEGMGAGEVVLDTDGDVLAQADAIADLVRGPAPDA
jgi:hypothetical protein